MTESHRSNSSHPAPTADRISSASPFTATQDARLQPIEAADEEPYTIKCICNYTDDDGNTIYCEECDTWQHIECYYPGNVDDASREDFDHLCVDCNPRVLDARRATERQRLQRQENSLSETVEKKTKRPPSKSHKKKAKPSDGPINGHRRDSDPKNAGQEQASLTKKTKSGHRSHPSVSSQSTKRSPSYSARPKHPLSPATTPPDLPDDLSVHTYSDHFIQLYDQDPGELELQNNTYASLKVSSTLSLWLRDSKSLHDDLGVSHLGEIVPMIKPDVNFEKHPWPLLEVKTSQNGSSVDPHVRWRYLTTTRTIQQREGLVGELKGMIGFQKEYCNADSEAYARTCHPAPFVFFHPRLPIYIDTRQEGSRCRYIRRSCQPNTFLEAFLYHGTEYRFCITADRTIKAGEQITLPWDFRFKAEVRDRYLYLLGLSDDDIDHGPERASESEYLELSELVYNVLSDHGGCACDLGNDCAFVRLHRNHLGRGQGHLANKPKKKSKSKQHISPTSTGQATNSRAASEGRADADGDDDNRSTSDSARSKPQSRDITPLAHLAHDAPMLELSDREKRKLAAIEESFQKIEHPPVRKKKRASEGLGVSAAHGSLTAATTKSRQKSISRQANTAPATANSSRPRQYADASTMRRSQSPKVGTFTMVNGRSQSQRSPDSATHHHEASLAELRSGAYTDCSTQTEADKHAWYNDPAPTARIYVSLRQRLLQNRQNIRHDARSPRRMGSYLHQRVSDASVSPTTVPVASDSMMPAPPTPVEDLHASSETRSFAEDDLAKSPAVSTDESTSKDVEMLDVPTTGMSVVSNPLPSAWTEETNGVAVKHSEKRSADLHIQMPAPPATLGQNFALQSAGVVTPSTTSSTQSPLGFGQPAFSPSLAKSLGPLTTPTKTPKKLSLSDYRARMKKGPDPSPGLAKTEAGHSPTLAVAVLPTNTPADAATVNGILDTSIAEAPAVVEMNASSIGAEAASHAVSTDAL